MSDVVDIRDTADQTDLEARRLDIRRRGRERHRRAKLLRRIITSTVLLMEQVGAEHARRLLAEAFDEAERIEHNQSLHFDEPDEYERAEMELTRRFDQAIEARKNFRVHVTVKDDAPKTLTAFRSEP